VTGIDNSKPYQIRSNIDCTISETQEPWSWQRDCERTGVALVLAADDMKAQAEQKFLIASGIGL